MSRLLAVLVLAVMVTGCAFSEDIIEIGYKPAAQATPREDAKILSVRVEPQDRRTDQRDRVSVKKNGYGMELAPIRSSRPVPEVVKRALEQELTAQGYPVQSNGRPIRVSVIRMYSDYRLSFFSADAQADIILHVEVPGGGFSRTYPVQHTEPNFVIVTGEGAQKALEAALSAVVAAIMADGDFHKAIQRAATAAAEQMPAS